jgi:dienelactone hydrolase
MTCRVDRQRRRLLVAGALAGASLALPLRAADDGVEAPFTVRDFDWYDAGRERAVPVRLYLPQADRTPLPLAVFSHGIGGSRMGYSYLGQHWAGHGMASLHLQHVGSDRSVWFGNPIELVSRLGAAAQVGEAIHRVHDLRFALDQLLAGELAPLLDARRIVAAGHSYGANTTLLAVGARVQRRGRLVDLRDERLRGAIVISAPPFYGEKEPRAILGNVSVPSLHVTATEDIIRIPGYWSGAEDRVAVFDAMGGPRKLLAVFNGGSHSMFTDRPGTGGVILNPQVKAATRELSTAFLREVFLGDGSDLAPWGVRHKDILARYVISTG